MCDRRLCSATIASAHTEDNEALSRRESASCNSPGSTCTHLIACALWTVRHTRRSRSLTRTASEISYTLPMACASCVCLCSTSCTCLVCAMNGLQRSIFCLSFHEKNCWQMLYRNPECVHARRCDASCGTANKRNEIRTEPYTCGRSFGQKSFKNLVPQPVTLVNCEDYLSH